MPNLLHMQVEVWLEEVKAGQGVCPRSARKAVLLASVQWTRQTDIVYYTYLIDLEQTAVRDMTAGCKIGCLATAALVPGWRRASPEESI
jgi:hypothetical protein